MGICHIKQVHPFIFQTISTSESLCNFTISKQTIHSMIKISHHTFIVLFSRFTFIGKRDMEVQNDHVFWCALDEQNLSEMQHNQLQ